MLDDENVGRESETIVESKLSIWPRGSSPDARLIRGVASMQSLELLDRHETR